MKKAKAQGVGVGDVPHWWANMTPAANGDAAKPANGIEETEAVERRLFVQTMNQLRALRDQHLVRAQKYEAAIAALEGHPSRAGRLHVKLPL